MITLSNFFQNQISSKQGVEPFRKLIVTDLKGAQEIDLSFFVTSWGSISRKLQYETGKSSPGGHSFTIQDSKALGKFLFTLGIEFGTEFWMFKEYDISIGFLNGQTEDTILFFTGEIFSKEEDRIGGSIRIGSKDVIKKFNDFKVCTSVKASDTFAFETAGTVDDRAFTQTVRYGTHKLIVNNRASDERKKRDDPFSMTIGFPSLASADIKGGSTFVDEFNLFYFPFQNGVRLSTKGTHTGSGNVAILTDSSADFIKSNIKIGQKIFNTTDGSDGIITVITSTTIEGTLSGGTDDDWDASDAYEISDYFTGGDLSIYFWDFIDDQWRAFTKSELEDSADFEILRATGANGIYLKINDKDITLTGASAAEDDWDNYIGKTTVSSSKWDDTERRDVAVAIETKTLLDDSNSSNQISVKDANPVRVIHDLIKNTRYIGVAETQIDIDNFDTADVLDAFSFDKTFAFIDDEGGKINTNFDEEVSLLSIIQEIVKISGMFFFSSAKKSSSVDRRIRIDIIQPISDCAIISAFSQFSTKDYIDDFNVSTSSDTILNKVIVANFDSSFSTRDNFDILIQEEAPSGNEEERILQLSTLKDPKAYWYDSKNLANGTAARLLSRFVSPTKEYNLDVSKAAMPVELADFIKVNDEISGEDATIQVFDHRLSLTDFSVSITGNRFETLFGPDPDIPLKKWAFVGCATYSDTDAPSGAGDGGRSYHHF